MRESDDGMLRIYTEVGLIPEGVRPTQILLPFLGNFVGQN